MTDAAAPDPLAGFLAAVQLRAENVRQCPLDPPASLWRYVYDRSARDVPSLLRMVQAALAAHPPDVTANGIPVCPACTRDRSLFTRADECLIRKAVLGELPQQGASGA